MYDPSCRIDWFREGYRQVWLYDGTKGSTEEFVDFCADVAAAIENADTLAALSDAIDEVAGRRSLVARTYPGPSHWDPLRLYVTVGVFAKETAPKGW